MPQLEGQPGSRGMNPPGGVSTINLYNWSDPAQPALPSRRNNPPNVDNVRSNENSASRPSAGQSFCPDRGGITRMHQAPGGNSTITFGVPSSPAENDAALKRRPGYDEKRKELYGSGIFNETSGSCDGDSGYGGFADKGPAAGETQPLRCRIQSDAKHKELFGSTPRDSQGRDATDYQEPRCRPTSDAKAKELNGSNIFGYSTHYDSRPSSGRSVQEPEDQRFSQQYQFSSNNNNNINNNNINNNNNNNGSHGANDEPEHRPTNHFEGGKQRELSAGFSGTSNESLTDMTGRLSFSNAKARELVGDNIFGPSPMSASRLAAHNREPAGKRSQLMLNNQDPLDHGDPYGQKKHEMKSAELSGNNIFHGGSSNAGDDMPQYQQCSSAKVREMSGSDIFSNDQPKARNSVGGIRKPPGGGSTIMLA